MNNDKAHYKEAISYLYGLQKYGIKFGLSKTSRLLKAFGDPHLGQKYVHVAGTNGKGSVASFLASILKQAGFKVGLYSSPHLVRFTERFRICDEEITQEKAGNLINELREAFAPDEPPTFFEATTAMALVYFARENTDIAIMEVGMGGRLDATNVISPLVSVITNISLEHQFFLGSRLLDIASEKAGIIKKDVDVITGATQPSVIALFKSLAKEKSAPLWRVGKDVRYRTTGSGLHYFGLNRRINGLHPGLKGKYQFRNVALALAALERLEEKGFDISSSDIREGLEKTVWPGRMHVIGREPTIILDGAHNPAAIRALADSIRSDFKYRRVILVIGVMEDKDIGQLLRGIVPLSDYVIYTMPVYFRASRPEVLMAEAAPLGKPGEIAPQLRGALDRAKEMANPGDLIVVSGSLFTVGEAMTYFDPETYRPDDL
ncbi:MAG: folylpolyglutamate synthase/dihydrofolate synthase family protein [Thermodesulfobacteriota bacterium]|nr:folylpolyglutamate synthase/dihydrofolate synthase family protein [Thermodesulfobacteriota bacterium]